MNNNNFGIYNKSFSEMIKEWHNYPEIKKAVIFGSRAIGNYKKGSDIDIAVFGKNIDRDLFIKLHRELNEELLTPYFIDIIHYETTENEELKKQILTEGKIIYENNEMKH